MIERDILRLSEQPGRPLDRMEADIWAGVAARTESRRASRVVLSCQAAVLAIALVGSVAAGTRAAIMDNQAAGLGVFSTRADLSPSTLLIGR